jgi:hypothetical protein
MVGLSALAEAARKEMDDKLSAEHYTESGAYRPAFGVALRGRFLALAHGDRRRLGV